MPSSMEKAIYIINYIEKHNHGVGASELSRQISMPKATVIRLLLVLEKHGYLEKDQQTKKYRLGIRLFDLGSVVLKTMDLHTIALPIMREINNLCGEGVYLNILNRNERMCLGFIQCNHSITAMIEIGQRSPLYAGASSKVMLAFLPESRIEALINSTELLPLTKSTITCRDALRKELAEVRHNRYAISKEERIVGAGSVSVPVFNAAGEVNASISVLLPLLRWDDNKVNEIIEILVDGGRRVSRQIGHKV